MADVNGAHLIEDGKFLIYKGRPLVRENNTICYGDMEDKYYLLLTIMSTKMVGQNERPDKVLIQIINTDKSLPAHARIEKQDLKNGLYEAFDLGVVWLERMLMQK